MPPGPPPEAGEQRPPGPTGGPRPRRRFTRRLAASLAVAAVLVLLAPTPLVDPLVHRVVSGYGGACAELAGLDVDSGSWPVVARAAAGTLRDVTVDVDEIRFASFVVEDARLTVSSADVAPAGAALVSSEADVRGGAASGTVRFAEIERILRDQDVDLSLRPRPEVDGGAGGESGRAAGGDATGDRGRMVADVEVPALGTVPTGVTVGPAGGDLEIRLAPLDLVTLPPVELAAAEPFRVESVRVLEDGIRVGLTFDGTVAAGEPRCEDGPPAP